MKEIKLSKEGKNRGKYVALVDDDDFEALNSLNWHVIKGLNAFYAGRRIGVDGKQAAQYMHCTIMNGKRVDHIDGNGLNNQRLNLRLCTQSENCMNRRKQKNTSSIYKGVYLHKLAKKWMAYITINGKRIHLGIFDTEVDAAKAYNNNAIELFGEFAKINKFN